MQKRKTPKPVREPVPKRQKAAKKPKSIVIEVKPLPKALVKRLEKAAPVIEKLLGSMKNIDHRKKLLLEIFGSFGFIPKNLPKKNITIYGRRVRQMNIKRNFPGVQLAIKANHFLTSNEVIDNVKLWVAHHNSRYKNSDYFLLKPIAVAISGTLIAMPKIDAPNVKEILNKKQQTTRGWQFFNKLNKNFGVTKANLEEQQNLVRVRTGILSGNIWLLGFKNGKFVFMAMPDYL